MHTLATNRPKATKAMLGLLLSVLLLIPHADAASPPSYFQQPDIIHSSKRALIDLVPGPSTRQQQQQQQQQRQRRGLHILDAPPIDPHLLLASDQRRIERRAQEAASLPSGGWVSVEAATAAASNATNSTSNSASNPSDKLSQLGFLGNAYNAALNMSSSTTGGSQLVFVQLDTASADLWVVSARCTESTASACASDDIFRFDESKSSSYAPLLVSGSSSASFGSNGSSSNSGATVVRRSDGRSARLEERDGRSTGQHWEGRIRRSVKRWLNILSLDGYASHPVALVDGSRSVRVAAVSNDSTTVPFSITYADRSYASGIAGVEDVTFAELKAPRQVFGLVDRTNVTLLQQGIGGILGLGFPRGSSIARTLIGQNVSAISNTSSAPPSVVPLMTTILSSEGSNVSYPLFSLAFNSTGGRMSIGAVDPYILPTAKDRALVDWHDVVPFPSGDTSKPSNATANIEGPELGSYVYWALQLAVAGVNGTSANISSSPYANYTGPSPLAIIDSGTRGILGPVAAVADVYSLIPSSRHVGNGQWVVPCDTTLKMHFGFGETPSSVVRNLTLLPSQYLIGPASGNPNLCFSWLAASLNLPSADGVSWTFGTTFFQAAYTIFSLGIEGKEAPKIGFYPMDTRLANLTASNSDSGSAGAGTLDASASAALFAPEPSESVASWLANSATKIASTLPNSLVALPSFPDYYMTPTYAFAGATKSPTPGLVPPTDAGVGGVAGQPRYTPVITAAVGNGRVPVIANGTTVQPIPSNPAADAKDNSAAISTSRRDVISVYGLFVCVAIPSLYFYL
ncbi:hypothetical protein CF327_g2118 [Tilletia walkeri]|nr:hypothetical protein CF327_g2118 [Tilletia walkeri]